VISPQFMAAAIQEWMDTGPNIRMSHDPKRPIGKGLQAWQDNAGATWVKSLICDDQAKKFIRKQVLTAYSVGISNAKIRHSMKAAGGEIYSGNLSEVTVCDRPSNPRCGIQIVKGSTYTNKVFKVKKTKLDKALERRSSAIEKAARIAGEAHQASLLKTAASQLAANPGKWAAVNTMFAQEAYLQRIVFTTDNPAEREAAREILESKGVFA